MFDHEKMIEAQKNNPKQLEDHNQNNAILAERNGEPKSLQWRSDTKWAGVQSGTEVSQSCSDHAYVTQFKVNAASVVNALRLVCSDGKALFAGGATDGNWYSSSCGAFTRLWIRHGYNGVGTINVYCNGVYEYAAGLSWFEGTASWVDDIYCPAGTRIYGLRTRIANNFVKGVTFFCGSKCTNYSVNLITILNLF
jgi:hypothetical protein